MEISTSNTSVPKISGEIIYAAKEMYRWNGVSSRYEERLLWFVEKLVPEWWDDYWHFKAILNKSAKNFLKRVLAKSLAEKWRAIDGFPYNERKRAEKDFDWEMRFSDNEETYLSLLNTLKKSFDNKCEEIELKHNTDKQKAFERTFVKELNLLRTNLATTIDNLDVAMVEGLHILDSCDPYGMAWVRYARDASILVNGREASKKRLNQTMHTFLKHGYPVSAKTAKRWREELERFE